jgi:DNA invertase Pin-like site-specific DNA recombinase
MALAMKKGKQIGRKKLSKSISLEILSLRSQGKGINLIAKTLGVGNGSVARVIKEDEKMDKE